MQFGAISLIPEPCGTAYEKLMAGNQDKVLCLDPNIRPSFINDPDKHRARIKRMAAMADVIKVSDEDLDWIAAGESAEAVMMGWLEGATRIVLMTRGGDGVDAFMKSGKIHQAANKVEVVDTIGAGDTFNAGFLAGLRRNGLLSKSALAEASPDQLGPVLALAARVAAHTVSKPGADPPWQHEL